MGAHVAKGMAIPAGEVTDEISPGVLFRHYARDHFARFRARFGITEEAYRQSLASLEGGTTQASGKSGSLFYFTADKRFVLKTISHGEKDKLLAMLPRYIEHFSSALDAGKPCLLSRFFAVYSVSVGAQCAFPEVGGMFNLVVMDNVFSGGRPDQIYDLKGTTEDRFVQPEEGKVLKDLNFRNSRLLLPEEEAEALLEAVRLDTAFLEEQDVMDYSLILGVFEGGPPPAGNAGHRDVLAGSMLVQNKEQPAAFQMAIIDMLVSWTLKKKAAYVIKWPTLGCCFEIDTAPPEYYRERFVDYLEDKVVLDDDDSD
mmetsp:Transcript_69295/g.206332  ORF Transcript_69295/g.206332 Transcript_69295/m.206332 type:complete len:313 (+) Transcript_69295:1-939(+)